MKPCTIRDACWAVCVVLGITIFTGIFFDIACFLFNSHSLAHKKLDSEAWMLKNCQDPVFRDQMRAHTNVCSEVEASARLGVWGAVMRDFTGSLDSFLDSWGFAIIITWFLLVGAVTWCPRFLLAQPGALPYCCEKP